MNSQHHTTIATGLQFRETLRAGPYAWPGGYPLMLLCSDGGALCFDCGRSEAHQIIRAIRDNARHGLSVGPGKPRAHGLRG